MYLLRNVSIRADTTLWLSAGAELHVMHATTAGNQLFGLVNDVMAKTNLTSARAGTTVLEVENAAGLHEGHRIVISGGTFEGSGVEEGPIEFNTVKKVESGSRLTVAVPMQYSYTSMGIPGAKPRVQSLGPASKILRNVRITGGKLKPFSDFDSIYFNFANVEHVEIDHVRMEGLGGGVATGHNVSGLNFHDNVVIGRAQAPGHGIDIASVVESSFVNNVFNIENDADPLGLHNHLVFEVTCRDNLIAGNNIGPVRCMRAAGIEFTFFSFGNRIVNNRVWGSAEDMDAGRVTLGIRTFANGINAAHDGNQIIGNKITDLMQGIADSHTSSVIMGNLVRNHSRTPNSIGINCGSGLNDSPYVANSFVNVAIPVRMNNGLTGGFAVLSGTSDPPPHSGPGSIYVQSRGARGSSLWRREQVGKSLEWLPMNRLPVTTFAEMGTAGNGTLVYVSDGVPGSKPLSGQGPGCVAVRETGAWRGL